jgi:uncharacterized protein (DUF1778 family)
MSEGDEEDFRSALRRAGITVQAERYDVMLAAYRDFQALMACLDEPFAYAEEPACTLQLLPLVTR